MLRKNLKTLLLLLILPFLLLATKTIVDWRKSAAPTPANIIIDTASPQGNIPSSLWQNLSQGGEEALDMIGPVINQVKALQPQLIRVDHLFDYYQVYQGPGNYDFSKLDTVINSILATGAKPMLSLSYTTADMAKNGQNAGEPSDWNQWYQLVRATAHRYSVEQNISNIYYEVWNEPDLFGGWHYGRSPSYTTLYIQTARGVVDGAGNTSYKVGGPAITAYYSNWIKSLFKTASTNRLRLDFISWHKYSKNPQDYEKDFENLNSILADYPQYFNVERLITEVGPNPEPDSWYDNSLSGIHLISLSTRLAGKIHRIFTFEPVDGPNPRSDKSTGWGLITHPSAGAKAKPRYYALQFLNQLTGHRLSSIGDGSHVTSLTSKNNQIIQTVLVNYDPRGQHVETVPVTFNNLPPGRYQLKTSKYLGSTTNQNFNITGNRLVTNIYLDPNTAVLLELIPQ